MKMHPVVHFELPIENNERAKKFYAEAFGWKLNQLGAEMNEYITAETTESDAKTGRPKQPGAINGGMFAKEKGNPAPSFVIAVDDIKKHMEIVKKAGGVVHGGPMEIPGVGQFVSFTDPEGNKLSMLQPMGM